MTISYSGNFVRLLFRWKGSIWRSVWRELLIYICLYYMVRFFYLGGIDLLASDVNQAAVWKHKFETLCQMFDGYCKLIPLTFLLGFYVSTIVGRWWKQFECLHWPEDLISLLCTVVAGRDEKSQKRRHMITRYINLTAALAWRDVSLPVRLRFPTMDTFIPAGLLTQKEFERLEKINESCESLRWMVPLHWIGQLVALELEENKPQPAFINTFNVELKIFRQSLRHLFCYDWVCVPLVYSQVAAMATYGFFFFALFGRQPLNPDIAAGKDMDLIIPLFLIVQFLFFVGWYKVGQDLMRPFGLDDDDIELNYILDRNMQTSFSIISKLQNDTPPEFEEDIFWKNRETKFDRLPHTEHSKKIREHPPKLHSFVEVEQKSSSNLAKCFSKAKRNTKLEW